MATHYHELPVIDTAYSLLRIIQVDKVIAMTNCYANYEIRKSRIGITIACNRQNFFVPQEVMDGCRELLDAGSITKSQSLLNVNEKGEIYIKSFDLKCSRQPRSFHRLQY